MFIGAPLFLLGKLRESKKTAGKRSSYSIRTARICLP